MNDHIVSCYVCGRQFTPNKFNPSKKYFCNSHCRHSYIGKLVTGRTKQAKCVDCGQTLTILSRASAKTCRCDRCKDVHAIEDIYRSDRTDADKFRLIHSIDCTHPHCVTLTDRLVAAGYVVSHVAGAPGRKQTVRMLSPQARDALRRAGLHSSDVQSEERRSKNEMLFCRLCEEYFKNVSHNVQRFNGWDADVLIEDIHVAVLWNGPWHYKQIKRGSSLQQIQNRDRIKLKEIERCGWLPYVIKDMGKYNEAFVKKKFDEFIKFLQHNDII